MGQNTSGVCLPQVVPNIPRVRLSVMKLCMYAWTDGWMCVYSMYVCMPYSQFLNVAYIVTQQ